MHPGVKLGVTLLLLAAMFLAAGCTSWPSGSATGTPAPTTAAGDDPALKTELADLAGSFAQEVDSEALAEAMNNGPGSAAFATVLDQLRGFRASDPRIAFVYTLKQQDGRVWFIVDADYGQPEGSDYMQEYTDAPAELKSPVTAPIGVGPYTDSWGTFISGYAPVDTGSNESVVLIGVDVRV